MNQLFDITKARKRSQSVFLNQLILILNDVFDAYQPPAMEDSLKNKFINILEELEKLLRVNSTQLGMETLTNAAYYFCKF